MYHIYRMRDPRDGNVHYIGLARNAYKRYAMHLLVMGKDKSEKDLWIQELLDMGLAPILEIIETVETRREAEEREQYWINYYLSQDAPLKNISKNRTIRPGSAKIREESNASPEEEQLRQLLKEHGWNLLKRKRREHEYLYAQKWKAGEVYITSLAGLPTLTREKVLNKIKAS